MPAPDLNFEVVGAEAPKFAAQPTLVFKLRVTNANERTPIHSVSLRSQIQLAVTRRRYSPEAKERLLDVFGEPQRWGETLREMLWTHVSTALPQFTGSCLIDLPVPCTYDFEVVSTKYFDALEDGEIPLNFLFSGTVFYSGEAGNLQAGQISWQKEATYDLPVSLWRAMIQRYYPNSAWLRLQKDVFDQLYQYKARQKLPTWDQVVVQLLENGDSAQIGQRETRSSVAPDLDKRRSSAQSGQREAQSSFPFQAGDENSDQTVRPHGGRASSPGLEKKRSKEARP